LKNLNSRLVPGFIARFSRLGVIKTVPPARPWQVVTLIEGSNRTKQRSLLMTGDDDEVFMTRSLYVTPPKTTEQHLIIRSDKSVTYVTNNKRLRLTFCTIEANY